MITSLLEPKTLLWIIPVMILFMVLFFKRFVNLDFGEKRKDRGFRAFIFISRTLIIVLLIIVLAGPFGQTRTSAPGAASLTILVDNTSSMQLMELGFLENLVRELEKEVPVKLNQLDTGTSSELGDSLLSHMEEGANLLLITDGNVNKGTALSDAALLAANLNTTLSAIELEEKHDEAGVYITGPESTVAGANNTFRVRITRTGDINPEIRVSIDNEVIFEGKASGNGYEFQREFSQGEHRLKAELVNTNDIFSQNNVFYKTVKVLDKPRILLVTDSYAPAEKIFNELYDVTRLNHIPENVNDYYAVIIYDQPANIRGVDRLADYLVDKQGGYYGNGLFVIGGFDSFDRGDYKNSLLESYLPVYVGKAARKRGSSNIVLAIDFSGSSGTRYEYVTNPTTGRRELVKRESNIQDVEKALAISVINSLGPDNSVGATVFSTKSAVVSELRPLFMIKDELVDKISRIDQPPGQSFFHIGLSGAYKVLKDNVGTNNIIMLTDGNTGSESIRQQTLDTAKTLNSRGIKIYVVGTGRNVDEDFLKDVAANGGGIYFPADQENRLRILFGEPEESRFGEIFDLFIINPYHYITAGLELDASLFGFNQVVPKTSAQLLITTQHGEPALTVWNYGLGRVACLNVFSGNNNLGDLLNSRNSVLLTRIANWAVGDPQRKEPYYVTVADTRIDQAAEVIVKSSSYPKNQELKLSKLSENQYRAEFMPEEKGFSTVLGTSYAVNYEREYQQLGLNPELESVTSATRGRMFSSSEADEIAEFVISNSKKTVLKKTIISWPFLLAAIIIFLIEVGVRKAREKKLNR